MSTEVIPNKSMLSGMDSLLSLSGDEFVEVVRRMPDGSYKNYRALASKLRVGKTAFDLALDNGFTGTEAEWLATLVGKSAYQTAVAKGEFVGTESEWVQCMAAIYELDPLNVGKSLVANAEGIGAWKALAITDVTGLSAALTATLKTADKATGAEAIAGTDDAKYLTAAGVAALLADIGFTQNVSGDWKLPAAIVAP